MKKLLGIIILMMSFNSNAEADYGGWIDMIKNEEAQILTSKTNRELLRRIHVIKNGKVISGAKAFLEIWKQCSPIIHILKSILSMNHFL